VQYWMLLGQILRNTFTIWNQSLTSTLIYFELSRPCICCTLKNVFICPSSFCHLCRLPQFGRRRVEILYTDLSMLDFELPRVAKKKNSNISAPRQNFKNLVVNFYCINMQSLFAKFQPSSFKTEGDVWGHRSTHDMLKSLSHINFSNH